MSIINSTILFKTFVKLPPLDIKELIKLAQRNNSNEISTLFTLLSRNISSKKQLSRIDCFHKCFGADKKYDDKKLRYLMSEGLSILHNHIINTQLKRDRHQRNLLLIKGLKYYGISEELHRTTNNALKKIDSEAHQNAEYHYYKYQFQKQAIQNQFGNKRRGELNLEVLHTALSNFYKTEFELSQLTTITHQVHNPSDKKANRSSQEAKSIIIYRLLKELLSNPNSKQYVELKPLIKDLTIFPPQEHREILLHLINYCIKQINKQEKRYVEECYDWYMWGLSEGILLDKGYVSKYTFKNIITLCLKSEEKYKADDALNNLAIYLPTANAEKILNYNKARIYFTKKEYEQSMGLLRTIEYDDLLDELDGRRMLMRIYFEKKEWIVLDSFLVSFEAFIRRQKSLGYHKDFYLNLVKYVKRAMGLHRMKPETKKKLIHNIKANDQVNDKQWLLGILS